MSDRPEWNEVSSLLQNIYRCADKSSWYDGVAAAYDRVRPRYPASILAQMQEIVQLQPNRSILEIGAGPGIASLELAKLGAEMVCLEPSKSACQIARNKCVEYPQVQFIETTFEAWKSDRQFDEVVATTSFHWLNPATRERKIAAVLKDKGWLVLLWNTPPRPSEHLHQTLAEVYQTHAPELAQYEGLQVHCRNLKAIADEVVASGYFDNLIEWQQTSQVTYTIDDYLTLLSTLSPYIRLDAEQRSRLFSALRPTLQANQGDLVELSFLSLLQVARKN